MARLRSMPTDAGSRLLDARDERGFALVAVMTTTSVLMLLAVAVVGYGVGSQNLTRHDQNWNAALASAEAGIDDYVFRLN